MTSAQGQNRHIALVTIGQSPRPDVISGLEMTEKSGVILAGALDGLTSLDVQAMAWQPTDPALPLFTWFEGDVVVLNKHLLSKRVAETVSKVSDGAAAVSVLCTESFPEIEVRRPSVMLRMDQLLFHTVNGLLAGRSRPRLGVLVPVEGQVVPGETRWSLAAEARAVCLPPRSVDETIQGVCKKLADLLDGEPDAIVLDCMGYGARERGKCEAYFGCPVVWPMELLKMQIHQYLHVTKKGGRIDGRSDPI
ncbi:AroM family protein [Alicyclobacillus mengziensis]|uniref:AroM family protein n=1 Tax=Alicyclobacillus mengziensis TaxID=2931921 RepID=A0A9X7VYY8_9BACL|nr:AroM family protein [Alicyclobacillus mengziensis]QSO47407.1 AroM family protein [Alicyclobacillus mengziensis]